MRIAAVEPMNRPRRPDDVLSHEILGRLQQAWLVISTLLLSWLLMQAVHELGHVVAAWLAGGRVTQIVLHPLAISRTDVDPNPHPLLVVWAGPVAGVVAPVLAWGLFAAAKLPTSFLRFFAGFCLIANGAYIGLGSFQRIGDCGVMLRYGSPISLLWLFGIVTAVTGLWLLDGTREYFALRAARMSNFFRKSVVTTIGLAALVAIELLLSPK
jgi:hypothetical protein